MPHCSWSVAISHIPLITGLVFLLTCVITYAWAVSLHHVPAIFPYISDTGSFPPESCFFGEMLNIGAVLIAVTVYFRYLELRDHVLADLFPRFRWLSRTSLTLGMISAFGVSLVANFQEVNQIELHIVGALMIFGLGAAYMYIETYITYKIHPGGESRRICHFRLVCSVVGLLAFISMIVTIAVAYHFYKPLDGRTPVNWTPADGGWEWHTASAISEWIVAFTEILFFATYTKEFRRFRLDFPKLLILPVESSDDSDVARLDNRSSL
ncbi:putative DNA damage-regulated autophagy modulator protein 1 [Hypsibius exemplaris]|uniref:DNA damage-regulated autophagy modulator protein 1 n=1 Tax=Hypsibius exemplaris TaxID=2072580 RepID=A0A1W0WM77_HYPEX|nr:putative DNA damage-regulated autophagy modulator protein 1 [Hypsibius exemplaris]